MDDLISRKAAIEECRKNFAENGKIRPMAKRLVIDFLKSVPAVEAEPVTDLKEFAQDVAYQFGYYGQYNGRLHIGNGGLSTLEWAFDILGWENPHPVPEHECEIDGCHEHATCGSQTADGYKRMCGRHMREKTDQTAEIDFDYEAED